MIKTCRDGPASAAGQASAGRDDKKGGARFAPNPARKIQEWTGLVATTTATATAAVFTTTTATAAA